MTETITKTRIQNSLKAAEKAWDIFYGLFSYLYLALRLFWEEYGEDIQVGVVRAVFHTVDAVGNTYEFGRIFRKLFDEKLTKSLDSAFFRLVDVQ